MGALESAEPRQPLARGSRNGEIIFLFVPGTARAVSKSKCPPKKNDVWFSQAPDMTQMPLPVDSSTDPGEKSSASAD